MADVLTDYTEEKLVHAIHDSWTSAMLKFFKDNPNTKYKTSPELTTIDNNSQIPMFNRVLKTNIKPENLDQKINETKEYFKNRNLPFTWQTYPKDKPDNLTAKLEEAGFKRDETPGMAVKLENLIEPKTPKDFRWDRVETVEELRDWSYLMCKAYGLPESGWDLLASATTRMGISDIFPCYTGFYRDEPVATSAVFYSEGVAGLYDVANLPEARGKGIGAMISYVSFIDAVERGYEIGILHSSKMGYNVYKRLGFEKICKLVTYVCTP